MYLGIDIGGTRLKAGLVGEDGRVLRSAHTASPASRQALESTLPALVQQVLADEAAPRAVGFGCKGIIDAGTTEVRTLPGVWGFLVGLRLSDTVRGLVDESTPQVEPRTPRFDRRAGPRACDVEVGRADHSRSTSSIHSPAGPMHTAVLRP